MRKLKIVAMPVIGQPQENRLESLRSCHAIFERKVINVAETVDFEKNLAAAMKELLLADASSRLRSGKQHFLVTLEIVDEN